LKPERAWKWPTNFDAEMELNNREFARLRETLIRQYAGPDVGMAFGRVVPHGLNPDAVLPKVEAPRPRPANCAVFPADGEPVFDEYVAAAAEFE
jgi:hypothetical protein